MFDDVYGRHGGETPGPAKRLPSTEASGFADENPAGLAGFFFPDIGDWQPVLDRLGIPLETALRIAAEANVNATDFQSELLAFGVVGDDALFLAMAEDIGVTYVSAIAADKLIVRDVDCLAYLERSGWHVPIKIENRDGSVSFLIAPEKLSPAGLQKLLAPYPYLASRLKLTSPRRLHAAIMERARPVLSRMASEGMFERFPDFSARIVANTWQGFVLGFWVATFPVIVYVAPNAALLGIHAFFTLFFFACVGLRFFALQASRHEGPDLPERFAVAEMPVYSVLVALYREEEVVPELIASLERLVWPRSKLEIKLVCESDDHATIEAIRACDPPRHFEIVAVPPSLPRTKPKALDFALPSVRGEFVVLYDAEDRPEPNQLIVAWRRFVAGGPALACLQAPLEISNGHRSQVARLFAFEYAALFRGILPWLSDRGLLMPLGGTSNHVRASVIAEVAGWDPHNVTEDADLGVRLARFGYRSETVASPTYEDGPEDIRIWVPQRTRWFKGWLQTWLVHMRSPTALVSELGLPSFLIFQILFAGMFISALAHPILIVSGIYLIVDIALNGSPGIWQSSLLVIDITNVFGGYLSFLLLGWQVLRPQERKSFWKVVLLTPPYWVMMSVAAWRALGQLVTRPHFWEKTPHRKPAGHDA